MSNTQDRMVSIAAATSSAGQRGSAAQRRQLALERYVAAIAGDKPTHLHAPAAGRKGRKPEQQHDRS